jgi:hypothetical protein
MNKVNEKVLYGLILPHELKAFVNLKATVDLGELPPLIDGFRVMPSENKRDGCLLEVIRVWGLGVLGFRVLGFRVSGF